MQVGEIEENTQASKRCMDGVSLFQKLVDEERTNIASTTGHAHLAPPLHHQSAFFLWLSLSILQQKWVMGYYVSNPFLYSPTNVITKSLLTTYYNTIYIYLNILTSKQFHLNNTLLHI